MNQNWPAIQVAEPVWRHQHAPARQVPLQGFEALAARKRYRRGQEIYKEDSPVEHWYRVVSGMARGGPLRASNCRLCLMRHQYRHVHIFQDVARDPPKDHFAQARMAVRSHDQEIGIQLGHLGEQSI